MGDYYHVTLEAYHDWDRMQAIRRCQMHGHPLDKIHQFFAQYPDDEAWTEVEVCVVITDFQSCLFEEPGFLLRVLEEAIWDYDADTNPIRERYPGLWEMEFGITEEDPSILWIMAQTYHSGEKIWPGGDNFDDALEARFIYPARFTPSLDERKTDWDGRGWHTEDSGYLQEHLHVGLRHAECRLLRRDLVWATDGGATTLHQREGDSYEAAGLPSPLQKCAIVAQADGVGFLGSMSHGQLDREGQWREWQPAAPSVTACGRATWSVDGDELTLVAPDGALRTYPRPPLGAVPERWVLALEGDGQPVVIAPQKLARWGGEWRTLPHPIERIRACTVGTDGTLWLAINDGLCSITPDDALRTYGPVDGLRGVILDLFALPQGVIWLVTQERFHRVLQIHTGAERLFPCEGHYKLAPERITQGAMGPDGSLWLLTEYAHLLRLQEARTPRYYAFDETLPRLKVARWSHRAPALFVSDSGDITCLHESRGHWISAATIAACDEQPATNSELFSPGQPAPFHFPQPAQMAAAALDLTGKRFHFIGRLDTMTQKQARQVLPTYGASYGASLSKHVTHAVRGTNPNQWSMDWQKRNRFWQQISDAEKRLIPVISEAEFLQLLGHAQPVAS